MCDCARGAGFHARFCNKPFVLSVTRSNFNCVTHRILTLTLILKKICSLPNTPNPQSQESQVPTVKLATPLAFVQAQATTDVRFQSKKGTGRKLKLLGISDVPMRFTSGYVGTKCTRCMCWFCATLGHS
jgi:hypothetical protein